MQGIQPRFLAFGITLGRRKGLQITMGDITQHRNPLCPSEAVSKRMLGLERGDDTFTA